MSIGVVAGFTSTKITTTAATTVTSVPTYATARLVATTTNMTLRLYNGSTAVTALVAKLSCPSPKTVDELSFPIRCDLGVRCIMSSNTGTAFIFVR